MDESSQYFLMAFAFNMTIPNFGLRPLFSLFFSLFH